jgi:hypothetical protein
MALHWDLSKIKDYKDICWIEDGANKRLNYITESIIWTTIIVDLGEITEKNLDEWRWRLAFLSQFDQGLLIIEDSKPRNPTKEELTAHIGLSTNVSTRTRREFIKRWVDVLSRNADRALR